MFLPLGVATVARPWDFGRPPSGDGSYSGHPMSGSLESETPLRERERLPMSTEILESSFGLYKQLERQHSKSGFTSLLACLPALLKPTTPEGVTAAFVRTSAKDVTAWTKEHFRTTVTSRRHAAYAEHRSAVKRATADTAVL